WAARVRASGSARQWRREAWMAASARRTSSGEGGASPAFQPLASFLARKWSRSARPTRTANSAASRRSAPAATMAALVAGDGVDMVAARELVGHQLPGVAESQGLGRLLPHQAGDDAPRLGHGRRAGAGVVGIAGQVAHLPFPEEILGGLARAFAETAGEGGAGELGEAALVDEGGQFAGVLDDLPVALGVGDQGA